MTIRPIIFSAPMVRALLAGTKRQTRRLATSPLRRCEVGDRLWVREAVQVTGDGVAYSADAHMAYDVAENHVYHPGRDLWLKKARSDLRAVGVPSIHMPRWASRLTLTVEAVRVEPLQAISEADAIAEGIEWPIKTWSLGGINYPSWLRPSEIYQRLWDSLHTAPGERWDDNPDVGALTFRVEQRNIDQ